MEEFIKNNPKKALENRRENQKRYQKIKEYYLSGLEKIKRGG